MASYDSTNEGESNGSFVTVNISNETPNSKIVLILGKDHRAPLTPAIIEEAWRVVHISSHGKVAFEYPEETAVGVTYHREDGTVITQGPHIAKPGSTWRFEIDSQYDDGDLIKENKAPPLLNGAYMVYNKLPATWSGRKINVALYKSGEAIIVKKNVRVGDYVELRPTDKLYFCCVEADILSDDADYPFSGHKGSTSEEMVEEMSDAEFTPTMKLDLKMYPNGVDVTIQENEISGQILFLPKPHY